MNAVETRGLIREYGDNRRKSGPIVALAGVDLTIETGEVRGLLGPNGAGKTTLCKILSTVLLPTRGTAYVLGRDVVAEADAVKRSVGVVFGGDRGLYGRLTAQQNLRFWAALYGLHGKSARRRVDELLDRVGLLARADERVDKFSRGMKQRLHLARGLVANPPVLILDEPTTGMDPVAAHEFRALVDELRADRRTVLLATHDMGEAEAVCDRITLVDHGTLLLTEHPSKVGQLILRHTRMDADEVNDEVLAELSQIPGVVSANRTAPGRVRLETEHAAATQDVLARLVAAGVTDMVSGRPSLEEVYLHLVGDRGIEVPR